jgi:hypothetical protein
MRIRSTKPDKHARVKAAAGLGVRAGKGAASMGKKIWATDTGKTVITGAAAGAAIATIIPFLAIGTGAIVGGVGSILIKNIRSK